MKIITKYDIEDWVYLVHDPEQVERMITEIRVTKTSHVYTLMCGTEESDHFDFEITNVKNLNQKFNN
ncbi:MAG: hypothetical protein ACJ749_18380 [Flavisolibacter sp.]|jgi:hypothetical protein